LKEVYHLLPFFLAAEQEEDISFFITRHGTMDEGRSHNSSIKNKISFHFCTVGSRHQETVSLRNSGELFALESMYQHILMTFSVKENMFCN